MRHARPDYDRFMKYVQKSEGCWLWTGAVGKSGYGVFSLGRGNNLSAHVYSFMAHGGARGFGQVVRHKCDVRLCVRPDHLLIGSQADNVRDQIERGRLQPKTKLSEADVIEIRRRCAAGETQRSLAHEFGVCQGAISHIVTRRNWKGIAS